MDYDFCYDPNVKGNFLHLPEAFPGVFASREDGYCTKDKPCDIGEGDCDSDAECADGLKCFQRNVRRSIPGLYVEHLPTQFDNWDFCYDPNYWHYSKMYAAHRGADGCTPANPCIEGEADCDSDRDCLGNRKCWQKTDYSPPTPGVEGEAALQYDYDVCYNPSYKFNF